MINILPAKRASGPRRVAVALLVLVGTATADETLPTAREVETARSGAIAQATDPALQAQLDQLYQQAEASVEAADAYNARLAGYREASTRRDQVRRKLVNDVASLLRQKATPTVTQRERTLDAAALESLLELTRSERATLEGKLANYELRLRTLAARPAELAREKTELVSRLAKLDEERASLMAAAADPVSRARSMAMRAEYAARQLELETLDQEQVNLGGDEEITGLRRELTLLELERLSDRVNRLGELLIDRREAEAADIQESVERARASDEDLGPRLQPIAERSAALSEELAALVAAQTETVRLRGEHATLRQRLNSEYETSRQRLQISETSAALGRVLVEKRRELPRLNQLLAEARRQASEVSRAALRRVEIEEMRDALRQEMETPAAATPPAEPVPDERLARRLSEAQSTLLVNLDASYAAYLRQLDASDAELQQLIRTVTVYTELLDQRLMWIPNTPPWSLATLMDIRQAAAAFAAAKIWEDLRSDLAGIPIDYPVRTTALLLMVLALLAARDRLRRRLVELARAQLAFETRRTRDTLLAIGVMALIITPWPLLLLGVGLALGAGAAHSELAAGLSLAAVTAAFLWGAAAWWSLALSAEGLAGPHLGADAAAMRRCRRAWRSFARIFIPTYSIAIHFEWLGGITTQNSIARLLFLVAMLALLALGLWLLRRGGPFATASFGLAREPQRTAWRGVLVAPPLIFVGLSALGYHYAAAELSRYHLMSAGLVATAILAYQITLKWIELAAWRTRRVRAAEADEGSTGLPDETDYARMNAQARMVMRNVIGWSLALALVAVWQTVLPALSVLDHVTLWEIAVTEADGAARLQPVTISNLALALIIAAVALVASWNLPAAIEIGLLQRLSMKQGSRYALTSLLQYSIIALGLSLALSTLGLRWSQVQWLVAALGVGLGFGLQEIFANFISGLILLFERPIRVGDVVTMGDLTGKVVRIRIRATTLRDPDNKEIIVPNKTFITERFLNWTLSDQITRVLIPVGVAYGTNLELAMDLLRRIVESHPKVLKDPKPEVVLSAFGDSAVNLELMVFAEELSARLDVRHELNMAIYRQFSSHGIEIPFPQQDLHLRSGWPPPTGAV